ncbi:MAG: 5'-3' exonuclease H3TH domain-containing protein [Patescibacteria group bacterium]
MPYTIRMKKFVLIDGNALIHRGFHAIPPLYTKDGEMTNAVYGFTTVFLGVLSEEAPDYIAVTFDKKGPTHRHEKFENYKGTRVKAPDELYAQIPRIKEVVRAFQIPIFEKSGFEADDLIATLTKILQEEDLKIVIVTGDKDALQLVSENVVMASPRKGYREVDYYTPEVVMEKLGITPEQVVDYKGLCGDASDNLPGVAGVGPKTAAGLLQKYGTLEGIYENIAEISGRVGEKIALGEKDAFFSRDLAQLVYDVPVEFNLGDCVTHEVDKEAIAQLFEELEFGSLTRKFNFLRGRWDHEKREKEFQESQLSLF